MDDIELALEEIAGRFDACGDVTWTSAQVAAALRRFAAYPEDALTNREDE